LSGELSTAERVVEEVLMDIVKKIHKSFHWTEEAKRSFKFLKEKITGHPVLVLPYFQ
jgi:hypothetical protein